MDLGSLILSVLMLVLYGPLIIQRFIAMWHSICARMYLIHYKKYVKREAIMLYHESGMWTGGMITDSTYNEIKTILDSLGGVPVDLILHTPGGSVFAGMLLSKLIKNYPDIRVVVPRYAMSGGTLLSLSGKELVMSDGAVLGPVDPQVGTGLFGSSFNELIWKEINKTKKTKVKDENIGAKILASQVSKTMRKHINELVTPKIGDAKKRKQFVDLITSGKVEHIYQLDVNLLQKFLDIKLLDPVASRYLYKIINYSPTSEVITTAVVD